MLSITTEQELKTKQLKRSLEAWREIILSIHSLLLWDKQWHPGALFGAFSALFLMLWTFDPSVLTTISTIGLLITIGDYLVPTIAAGIFRNDMWTSAKEKKFDEICRQLVAFYSQICSLCTTFYTMRSVRPKLYYPASIVTLVVLAYIGSVANNLLLTYILVISLVMLPGMERQGIIAKYGGQIANKFRDLAKKNITKVEAKTD